MERMTFGDRPSQYYLEECKMEIARYAQDDLNEKEFAAQVIASSYVDDICPSFETKEEAEKFIKILPKAFGALGFKFKEITLLGPDQEISASEPAHMFGHMIDFNTDRIFLKFVVNMSATKRGQKTGINLTSKSNLDELLLTKRKVQGLLGSQYDPLGLATPWLAKYKLYLSHLHKTYGWDEKLKYDDQLQGKELVRELIKASESQLSFPRCNKPKGSVLKKLVAFSDGSSVAFATVLYGIYEDKNQLTSSLLTSKMKIDHHSVPRHELCGLLASHRLVKNYLQALDKQEKELEEISFVVDSTCCLDYLNDSHVTKDVYVTNRIHEI